MSGLVTRKMVAQEAGVSETIVSYVINNNRYVDGEKRIRVNKAIEKLGYRPNAIARTLKSKKSNHILFIADQIENEHFGKLLSEMDSLLYNKGYLISLAHNRDNDEFIRHIISRQFDGIIISSISMREQYIREISNAGIPVVLMMNRNYNNLPENTGRIYPGLYEGAGECVRHLYETGCGHIMYIDRISRRGHFSDLSDLRLKGYMDEMVRLGLPLESEQIITGCETEADVIAKIAAYVKSGKPLDAIFCRNDRLAFISMEAVREAGLNIPDDVSVVGFDNSSISRYTSPPLTTAEIDRTAMAQSAVNLLERIIEDKEVLPVKHKTKLVIRGSTKGAEI